MMSSNYNTVASTESWHDVTWITDDSNDVTWMGSGCRVVHANSSEDLAGQLISNEVERLINRLKAAIFIPICFLIGSPANCLCMIVFYRHGLANRINLILFCLAFVDLLQITFTFILYAERIYTQFVTDERYTKVIVLTLNNGLMGFYGSGYTDKILITIIGCERCLSILVPMKSKTIVSLKATGVILFLTLTTTFSASFIVSRGYRLACVYDVATKVTSWQLIQIDFYRQHIALMTALDNIFIGLVISVICPLIVFVTTIIMIVKLSKVFKWRQSTVATSSESSRDRGVTRMLLALSVEFLVCSIPHFLFCFTPLFIPDFRYNKFYANTRDVLISLLQLGSSWRSSVNFFVYYFFGSRFRETLRKRICSGRERTNLARAKYIRTTREKNR